MRRSLELVALAAGLAALALLCWQFGLSELGVALVRVRPRSLLVYLAFGIAARLGYALRWWLLARTLGAAPRLSRCVVARLAGDATGFLLPTGRISGDPLRIGLVYGVGVSGSQASAGVAIDRIVELISSALCGVTYVTVFSLARTGGTDRPTTILVVTLCLLLGALILPLELLRRGMTPLGPIYWLMMRSRSQRWAAWSAAVRRTETLVMRFLHDHPATFIEGLVASLFIEALIIGEYHFLLESFALVLDLPTLLMTLIASGLALSVPTPAGLGALEAGQVTVLAAATGQPGLGFVVGLVLRLHETLWTGVGLVALSLCGVGWARLRGALVARGYAS